MLYWVARIAIRIKMKFIIRAKAAKRKTREIVLNVLKNLTRKFVCSDRLRYGSGLHHHLRRLHLLHRHRQSQLFHLLVSCFIFVLCCTGLPFSRTSWVWSTFSSHCPLSYNQRHWLTSATSTIVTLKIFGNAGNWLWGFLVRSEYATSVLCRPSTTSNWNFIF